MKFSSLYELFPKTYYGNESEYPKFDGTDIINVDRVKDIPNDYFGEIGVPATFADFHSKYIHPFKLKRLLRGGVDGKIKYMRYVIQRMTDEEWRDYVDMMMQGNANGCPLDFKQEEKMYESLKEELYTLYEPLGFNRTKDVVDPMIKWDEKRICHVEGVGNYPPAKEVLDIYRKYFEKYKLDIKGFTFEFHCSNRDTKMIFIYE